MLKLKEEDTVKVEEILKKVRKTTIEKIEKTNKIRQEDLNEAKKYSFKCCPDQIVASLQKKEDGQFDWLEKITTKKQEFFKRKDIVQESDVQNDNIILLILESPHKDEFNESGVNGPAFGQTGIYINNYFVEILDTIKSLLTDITNCKIIIVNAIQYACSLGLQLKEPILKNLMLKNLWEEDCFKENFRHRIKTILSATHKNGKRTVVINCCTKPIKKDVSCELKKLGFGFVEKIYEAPHPRYWNWKKGHINIITIPLRKKDNNQV